MIVVAMGFVTMNLVEFRPSIQIKEIDALVPCRIKVWREKYSTYPIFVVCCLSNIHVYWKVSTF